MGDVSGRWKEMWTSGLGVELVWIAGNFHFVFGKSGVIDFLKRIAIRCTEVCSGYIRKSLIGRHVLNSFYYTWVLTVTM